MTLVPKRNGHPGSTGRRTRVLWLTKGLGRGGTEHLLVLLARNLDPAAFDITVAYTLPHKDSLVPDLREAGAHVRCLGSERRPRAWPARLWMLLRDGRYDVVHTHSPVLAGLARLMPAGRGARFLHTEHSEWGRYRLPSRWVNRLTYSRNRHVFAVSEAVRRSIRPIPGLRVPPVEVLYHGIDESKVRSGCAARRSARTTLGLGDGPLIGSVGSLTPKKGHSTLIAAMPDVRTVVPGAQLVIIGGGPRQSELEAEAEAAGLTNCVHLLGVRSDVQELLPAFDLFALASNDEGLGLALIEAMAAGVPCVATAVGGINEVVRHGASGLLVPPADPSRFAAAIIELLEDDQRRATYASQALEDAKRFSMDGATRTLAAAYQATSAAPSGT